jgi:hypothetical protein
MTWTEQPEQVHGAPDGGQPGPGSQSPPAAQLDPAGGNIDKIRDILFGANMREYEARFERLEETLLKEAADLRESSRRRFESLETYVKNELESLQTRVKIEREERSDASSLHAREMKEIADALAKKIRDLDDQSAAVASSLRQEILNQARNLMDELRSRHEETAGVLEKRFQTLQHGKTDRAALASLLTEVAMRINDEFHIPGTEK